MLDYETLRLIWWAAARHSAHRLRRDGRLRSRRRRFCCPSSARPTRTPDRINTVGPVWEGNQVWLILGGGAIFAAWPTLYAVSFSGFYLAMFLVLVALILRPVGFKFRSKLDDARWRAFGTGCCSSAASCPSLIFGVAFGNVLQGVPFRFDDTLRMTYDGNAFRPAQSRSRSSAALSASRCCHAWRRLSRAEGSSPCASRASRARILRRWSL